MKVGVISCEMLAHEIKRVIVKHPEVTHLEIMDWRLHINPELLCETLSQKIYALETQVDTVVLAYGRCQTMDKLPRNFKIPVFYPKAEDCIGVLLGQKRYQQELLTEAGTWFLTPGWTEMGMSMIFHELQLEGMAENGHDPLALAHRMLKDYTRALYIRMPGCDQDRLRHRAQTIAQEFNFRLEECAGAETRLQRTLKAAIAAGAIRQKPSDQQRWGVEAI